MLRSSLKTLLPEPGQLLDACDIDSELRAEQVPVDGFARLAARFASMETA
jgi:16S rRNA A1518/A1519 N6-dimethyltransferase RsmA/KsgA/DIM1 with predicted DNA glycosylase/AP lyase activity